MSPGPQDRRLETLISELLDGDLSTEDGLELLAAMEADDQVAELVTKLYMDSCVLDALHGASDPGGFVERILLHVQYVDTGASFTDRVAKAASEHDAAVAANGQGKPSVEEIRRYAERQLQADLAKQEELRRQQRDTARPRPQISLDVGRAARKMAASVILAVRAAVAAALLALAVLVVIGAVQYLRARRVVATLGDSVHATWAEPPVQSELRPGRMTLEQGFARIVFTQGAEVLIQAPCELELRSRKRMHLQTGTITAKVPKHAAGFVIETPNHRVVDYGTEFGLMVEASSQSELHVFKGQVGVRSHRMARGTGPQRLTEGQAATVDPAGRVNVGAVRDRPNLFVRQLPDANQLGIPGKRLDLADVVGGGNGFGSGWRPAVLDPRSGQITRLVDHAAHDPAVGDAVKEPAAEPQDEWKAAPPGRASGHYVLVRQQPFIDGVFVPDGRQGRVIISSSGHEFPACPSTNGEWLDGILNGVFHRQGQRCDIVLQGRWLTAPGSRASILKMHSNLGITFDLAAMRRSLPGTRITALRTRCGNAASGTEQVGFFDVYVLVDGHVRYHQNAIATDTSVEVHVPLDDRDRFLTLATLMGADGHWTLDRAVFVEPVLELESAAQMRGSHLNPPFTTDGPVQAVERHGLWALEWHRDDDVPLCDDIQWPARMQHMKRY